MRPFFTRTKAAELNCTPLRCVVYTLLEETDAVVRHRMESKSRLFPDEWRLRCTILLRCLLESDVHPPSSPLPPPAKHVLNAIEPARRITFGRVLRSYTIIVSLVAEVLRSRHQRSARSALVSGGRNTRSQPAKPVDETDGNQKIFSSMIEMSHQN